MGAAKPDVDASLRSPERDVAERLVDAERVESPENVVRRSVEAVREELEREEAEKPKRDAERVESPENAAVARPRDVARAAKPDVDASLRSPERDVAERLVDAERVEKPENAAVARPRDV